MPPRRSRRRLTRERDEAAAALDFECAARRRDQLATLHMAVERQQVVTERPEDLDVVGIDDEPLEAAVCVFHVRRGRIVGRRAFIVDKVEDLTLAQLVGRVLEQLYGDAEPPAAAARPAGAGPPKGTDGSGWTSGAGEPVVVGGGRRRRPGRPPAGARARAPRGAPRPTAPSWPTGAGRAGGRCGCPSGGASGASWRRWPATPARSWSGTGCGGRRTTTAGSGPSSPCRARSTCPPPRCASSATT